jgi:prevent-host-death family protein
MAIPASREPGMNISSTDAKNRFGQVLEQAQKRPVIIEKSGRRHSVVLSAELYDQLLAAQQPQGQPHVSDAGRQFYRQYKSWVDEQNADFEAHGIWNDDLRSW